MRFLGSSVLLLLLTAATVVAQSAHPEVPVHSDPVVQGVQAHLNRWCERHHQRLGAVRDRPSLESELQKSRRRFLDLLDLDLESPRQAPRVTHVGVIDGGQYLIEKIVLETEPGVPVPCNLYVPKGGPTRKPALLMPHGHSGRDRPVYQNAYQRFAKAGFIVLAKDGWGKQERRGTGHGAEGGQLFLTGSSLMALELWDNIRCVDYLLSRPDVHADQVGMAGISGGGSQTLYTMAIEPRLKAGSPTCAVTTFRSDLADTTMCVCEMLTDVLTVGDHGLFLAMAYPRPLLVVNGIEDPIFPIAGARAATRQARALYAAAGREEGLAFAEFPDGHTWSDPMIDRQIHWFRARFGLPAMKELPTADGFRPYAALQCFPDGRIPAETLTLSEWNRKRMGRPARRKAAADREETGAPAAPKHAGDFIRARWTGEPSLPTEVQRQDLGPDAQKLAERLRLSWPSGLGGTVSALISRPAGTPPTGRGRLVIRLDRDRQLPQFERLHWDDQARTSATVVEFSYTGRTLSPRQEGQVGSALVASGSSLLAERARDLLVLLKVLEKERLMTAHTPTVFYGHGFDGVLLLTAAPLLPESAQLVLDGTPITYRQGAELDFTTPELLAPPAHWTILPNLARTWDLPDLLRFAAPRSVLLAYPRDAAQAPLSQAEARRLLQSEAGSRRSTVEIITYEAGRRRVLARLVEVIRGEGR